MIGRPIRSVLLAAAVLTTAWQPTRAATVTPGIYGNVELSEESGDLGGAELELIGTGADSRVEFVLCEGWCNSIHSAPVRLTADGFEFSYVEQYVDQDGNPVPGRTYHAKVAPKGRGVTVTITPSDQPDWFFGYELQPIDKRFGLYVASDEDR